jgi:hypothetical protein
VKEARVMVCWVDVMSKWKKVVEDLSDPDTAPLHPRQHMKGGPSLIMQGRMNVESSLQVWNTALDRATM